ncbi:hypothetical protein P170DRAFT_66737 [Aspergillus steynii IBT 23096]|uniref:Secreted protein n=1 Tax=Aspergillus steynii IBT 23096 TaxID=1392250 RepID=A0A2I2FTK1_9EURO|nr:uncharacterized protein P170DRAFT_66737 [Aspergillus steynii IBT 23096]PLB43970.1 hypothetical protein P170DRAFT_66737 [Aspergillus steynii IBT 23096]
MSPFCFFFLCFLPLPFVLGSSVCVFFTYLRTRGPSPRAVNLPLFSNSGFLLGSPKSKLTAAPTPEPCILHALLSGGKGRRHGWRLLEEPVAGLLIRRPKRPDMPERAESPRGNDVVRRPSHRLSDPEAGRTQFLVGPRRSAGIRQRRKKKRAEQGERVRGNRKSNLRHDVARPGGILEASWSHPGSTIQQR